jgi:hypothetical protein
VSYLAPNYEPLIESGQMTLLDTERIKVDPTICPGISVELFPGHTAQLMAVHIESKASGGGSRDPMIERDIAFPSTLPINAYVLRLTYAMLAKTVDR